MSHRRNRPLFLAFLLLLASSPVFATTFVRVADQDLADTATVIVEVEIVDAVDGPGAYPATDVSTVVRRVIKGDETLGALTFRRLGGIDPFSGHELKIYGNPDLRRGARALLFLVPDGDVYRPLHLFQGFFHVAAEIDGEGTGKSYAFRNFGQAREVTLSGRKSLEPEGPRDYERFVRWLEDRAAGELRPADYFASVDLADVVAAHQKFGLITRNGFNVRWQDFEGNNPSNPGRVVRYFSPNGNQPGLPSGGHSELQQALAAWTNHGGSDIRLAYGGRTGATGGLSRFDGVNAVLWSDPAGVFDTNFSCASGGTIAGAGPWTSTDPNARHSFANRTFVTILGGDIVTNEGIACWININNRAQEVFAHELGHTLGLGHSCNLDNGGCSGALNQALMRAQAHGDGRGATLGSDDRAAVSFLYPAAVSVPNAPSNLQADAQAPDRIRLTWNDNSNNESSFVVERRAVGGGFSQVGTTGTNVRSFIDNSVASGTSYDYRVSARNGAGSSDLSNVVSVTTPGASAPSNVTAQVLSATSVRLTWTDNSQGETGFEIDADGFGAYFPAERPGPNAASSTLVGLNPNTSYTFRIRSVGAAEGKSSYVESNGVTTLDGTPDPCRVGANTQCLADGRFQVKIGWRNFDDDTGTASVVDIPAEGSGLFWFFDDDNWELLVKVLDGCALTDHFWVFAAATTNLEYLLQVIDTQTGNAAIYENPLGTSSAAITDTEALACPDAAASAPDKGAVRRLSTTDPTIRSKAPLAGTSLQTVPAKMDCIADDGALCLSQNRFRVEVDWRDFADNRGTGKVVALPVTADDSGLFWFFQADNWEMLIKVLDGCGINQRFWVFSAATTNVEYTLRVTDTQTGQVRTYPNALGTSSPALTDAEAFATCP